MQTEFDTEVTKVRTSTVIRYIILKSGWGNQVYHLGQPVLLARNPFHIIVVDSVSAFEYGV